MALVIKRTNTAELSRRRDEVLNELVSMFEDTNSGAVSREDLAQYALQGYFSVEERRLYDELRRIEMLLEK